MSEWKRYVFGRPEEGDAPLTPDDVSRICREGAQRRPQMAGYSLEKIMGLFGRLHERWSDPAYARRRETEELLCRESRFSRETVARGVERLAKMFHPESLKKACAVQLGGIPRAGSFEMSAASGVAVRWYPCGVLLHVLAGNTFLAEVRTVINGILTGNVNIFKSPTANVRFLPKVLESLCECDDDGVVSRSLSVLSFPAAQKEVIAEFKRRVDGIVVWGGEEAARSYREDLPARCRLVLYGPKLSLAVLTRQGLAHAALPGAAKELAFEIAQWDQSICHAPQACFVEGRAEAVSVTESLAQALEEAAQAIPPGPPDMHTAIEIQKLRAIFEVAEARGEGLLRKSPKGLDWTVILDPSRTLEPSPLHRTIRIIPFQDFAEVIASLEEWRGYIQTVGLLAGRPEYADLSARLAECGASRITGLGGMGRRSWEEPHDGGYGLQQLMRLVSCRLSRSVPPA